tara:strand:+ start:7055 stop:7426 length:372 start_codon:yes stop_codon:yes gene_type:complete
MKKYCKEKSHLSAYQLEKFVSENSIESSVIKIPGVGEVTYEHFKKKNINTIGDLLNNIDSYNDLLNVLPKYVNSHRIFCAISELKPSEVTETNANNNNEITINQENQVSVETELEKIPECQTQ